jgi:hypothetical protein
MSAWSWRSIDGGRPKDCSASSSNPMMEGPWCRFRREEKHEPVSDIDTVVVVDSLKALDPKRPIREADIANLGLGRQKVR